MKICYRCRINKPLDDFHKFSRSLDGHDIECKECKKKRAREYYRLHSKHILKGIHKFRKRNPGHYLLKLYGFSFDDKKSMAKIQEYKCLICGKICSLDEFHIDHSHKTGKVRGLLCGFCNGFMLGLVENHLGLIKKSMRYLREKG